MNDYEVTVVFKVSASDDDDIGDIMMSIFDKREDIWDFSFDSEQLTFSEAVVEDLE